MKIVVAADPAERRESIEKRRYSRKLYDRPIVPRKCEDIPVASRAGVRIITKYEYPNQASRLVPRERGSHWAAHAMPEPAMAGGFDESFGRG